MMMSDAFFPDCPIVDPHHHLFPGSKSTKPPAPVMQRTFGLAPNKNYLAKDLEKDIASMNVCATVHAEAKTGYDRTLPKHLQSIGETRFLLQQSNTRVCRGIIIGVDLTTCTEQEFCDAIEFHQNEVSVKQPHTKVCGVRATLASDDNDELYSVAKPLAYKSMVHNARLLGLRFNLPLDVWMYARQLNDLYEFALECPQTKFVCDHVGTPLFPGEMNEQWKLDMLKLAQLPNVHVKLGGLGMHCCFGKNVVLSGKRWLSDDICRNLLPYYQHVFNCFGPQRVMFESNFPMDSVSYTYESFWSAAKKMSVVLSKDWEVRRRILFTNANELYQLNLPTPELHLYAFGESKL